jgi:hypothetical protein
VVVNPTEDVFVVEFPLFTASGVAASPGVEDDARGVTAGEAGLGADGIVGSLAALGGATCKGSAAPAAGKSGLTLTSVIVELFNAVAGWIELAAAAFGVGAAAAFCTV